MTSLIIFSVLLSHVSVWPFAKFTVRFVIKMVKTLRSQSRVDETVSIGPSLCSVTEWSVSVAGTKC